MKFSFRFAALYIVTGGARWVHVYPNEPVIL